MQRRDREFQHSERPPEKRREPMVPLEIPSCFKCLSFLHFFYTPTLQGASLFVAAGACRLQPRGREASSLLVGAVPQEGGAGSWPLFSALLPFTHRCEHSRERRPAGRVLTSRPLDWRTKKGAPGKWERPRELGNRGAWESEP